MISLVLPWPPTVNHYYRSPRAGARIISTEGRTYRQSVLGAVLEQLRRYPRLSGRLRVKYDCSPPDLRKRDLSNLLKAMEDALTHAGVWNDDGQIDEFSMRREFPEKPGNVKVTIEEL